MRRPTRRGTEVLTPGPESELASPAQIERLLQSVRSWSNGVGDFDSLPDLYHEDMELRESPGWPVPGVHKGLNAFAAYWRQFAEQFEVSLGEVEEIFVAGDKVLAYLRCVGRDRQAATKLDLRFAVIYTFRGDKIALVEPHLDRADAFAAWRVALGDDNGGLVKHGDQVA